MSPLVSHGGLHLALTAAAFTAGGWLLWRDYARRCSKFPEVPEESAALEPTDEL